MTQIRKYQNEIYNQDRYLKIVQCAKNVTILMNKSDKSEKEKIKDFEPDWHLTVGMVPKKQKA